MTKEDAFFIMVSDEVAITHPTYNNYPDVCGRIWKDGKMFHCDACGNISGVSSVPLDLCNMAKESWSVLDTITKKEVTIDISGPTNSGKTRLALIISSMLDDLKIEYDNDDDSNILKETDFNETRRINESIAHTTKVKIISTRTLREN